VLLLLHQIEFERSSSQSWRKRRKRRRRRPLQPQQRKELQAAAVTIAVLDVDAVVLVKRPATTVAKLVISPATARTLAWKGMLDK
jgi:hypothetical protein